MPRPKGGYRNSQGMQLPGVTTVISRFKDATNLLYWAFNQGKSGVENLYDKADESADIGTLAHAMFEAHRKHLPPPEVIKNMTPENLARAETAFLNALEWERQVEIESVAVEISLICECHQYGCTIDEIARIRGHLVDFEWKTSNGVYVDHLLQCAAQAHVWNCNNPKDKVEGAAIVRWGKESGDFAYHYFTDLAEPFAQFVAFRECYDRDRKLKRRV